MSGPVATAWLCELAMEDGTTREQVTLQDPAGFRWNDEGEPSPFRVTPLYTEATIRAWLQLPEVQQ